MFQATKAGALYAIVAFSIGFILGTIRVLLLAPRPGETTAVIIEAPIMLAASWFVCRWCVDWLNVRRSVRVRSLMGSVALVVLVAAEIGLGVAFCRSFVDQLAAFKSSRRLLGSYRGALRRSQRRPNSKGWLLTTASNRRAGFILLLQRPVVANGRHPSRARTCLKYGAGVGGRRRRLESGLRLLFPALHFTHDLLRNFGNRAELNRRGDVEAVVCTSWVARSRVDGRNPQNGRDGDSESANPRCRTSSQTRAAAVLPSVIAGAWHGSHRPALAAARSGIPADVNNGARLIAYRTGAQGRRRGQKARCRPRGRIG